MIIPAEQLSLEQARQELEKYLARQQLTPWAVGRIQALTYRIHELDPTEIETYPSSGVQS